MVVKRTIGTVVTKETALPIESLKSVKVGTAHEVDVAESVVAVLRPGPKPPGDDDGPPGPTKQGRDWMDWANLLTNIGRLIWAIGKDLLQRLSALFERRHEQPATSKPE